VSRAWVQLSRPVPAAQDTVRIDQTVCQGPALNLAGPGGFTTVLLHVITCQHPVCGVVAVDCAGGEAAGRHHAQPRVYLSRRGHRGLVHHQVGFSAGACGQWPLYTSWTYTTSSHNSRCWLGAHTPGARATPACADTPTVVCKMQGVQGGGSLDRVEWQAHRPKRGHDPRADELQQVSCAVANSDWQLHGVHAASYTWQQACGGYEPGTTVSPWEHVGNAMCRQLPSYR
jgi:hypothetical protein